MVNEIRGIYFVDNTLIINNKTDLIRFDRIE
jgi:hypothetical protein